MCYNQRSTVDKILLILKGRIIMKKLLSVLVTICLFISLCGCTFLKDVTDFALNDEAVAKTFRFDVISI